MMPSPTCWRLTRRQSRRGSLKRNAHVLHRLSETTVPIHRLEKRFIGLLKVRRAR
jgi:hypothetical protein